MQSPLWDIGRFSVSFQQFLGETSYTSFWDRNDNNRLIGFDFGDETPFAGMNHKLRAGLAGTIKAGNRLRNRLL
jgi:hypothetical protein